MDISATLWHNHRLSKWKLVQYIPMGSKVTVKINVPIGITLDLCQGMNGGIYYNTKS